MWKENTKDGISSSSLATVGGLNTWEGIKESMVAVHAVPTHPLMWTNLKETYFHTSTCTQSSLCNIGTSSPSSAGLRPSEVLRHIEWATGGGVGGRVCNGRKWNSVGVAGRRESIVPHGENLQSSNRCSRNPETPTGQGCEVGVGI